MSEQPSMVCPRCRRSLPPGAPEGLCPRCLGAMNLADPTEIPGETVPTNPDASVPSPESLAPLFPQLEILRCLGRGGMGVVYEARQKSLDRRVALKVLAPGRERDAAFTTRFLREARALARLSHPNIVTVHDFGEAGGLHYLLMEHVDGVNLRQLLSTRRVTPEQALTIVPPICDALQYAHEHGVIHRDIKPENLLLDKQGRVKIADFGIARLLDPDGRVSPVTEPALGTPDYMAPEQRQRPHTVDCRADIYSLGVVLYEMLTGELPAGRFEPPSRRVQVDVRLDEIVLKALEREPERRYATAQDLKSQVESVSVTTPRVADPGPPSTTGMPTGVDEVLRGRRRWARVGFAALLAGTLGTLVLMTLSPRHELALVFAGIALLLALIVGIKTWRDRLGRTVAVSTLVVLGAAVVVSLVLSEVIPIHRWTGRVEAEKALAEERRKQVEEVARAARDTKDRTSVIRVLADGRGDYPSIQAALDAALPGALVRVGPGRFPENLTLRRPVRLVGEGWEQSVIGPEAPPAEGGGTVGAAAVPPTVNIDVQGVVELSGMRFTQSGPVEPGKLSAAAVIAVRGAELQMKDCAVVGGPGNGVVFGARSIGRMERCLVAALWNTGVVVESGGRVLLEECDVRNCFYAGVVLRKGMAGAELRSNRISGAAWHGVRYDDVAPVLRGNFIFSNARSGVYASGACRARLEGNVFFDNEMSGVSCWFDNQDVVVGNTFLGNRREALAVLGKASPMITSNLFVSHPVALMQGFIGGRGEAPGELGTPRVEHNLFWKNGTNWVHPELSGNTTPGSTALDASNQDGDPGWANPLESGFHRPPGSRALQWGVGAGGKIPRDSPWPLQPEERAIVPDGNTRDSRSWKRP